MKAKTQSKSIVGATVSDFLSLTSSKLQDFIHARRFDGQTFQQSKVVRSDGKLNKTRYKGQTAVSIQEDCSDAVPCLVWLAWKLRSNDIKLKARPVPVLDARMPMPDFTVVYAGPVSAKLPREYLQNTAWVNAFKSVVKGVNVIDINEELTKKADNPALLLVPRLAYHISNRVDQTRRNN